MTKLILIRHGESVANKKGIYQGQSVDTSLSALGRKQARLLAKRLAREKVDLIFTSPLLRAKETAVIISRQGGLNVIEDVHLLEINHGKWEGKNKNIVQKNWGRLLALWQAHPIKVHMPDGESLGLVHRRVTAFLSYLEESYRDKTLVIVGHDVVLRLIVARALGLPDDEFWSFSLDNCALTVIISGSPLKVLTLNDASHLRACRSRLDRQAL